MSTVLTSLNKIYHDSDNNLIAYTVSPVYDSPTGGSIVGLIGNVHDGELYVLNAPFDSSNPLGNTSKIATISKVTQGTIKEFTQNIYYSYLENIKKYGIVVKNFNLDKLYISYNYEPITKVSLTCNGNIDSGLNISWSTGSQVNYSLKVTIGNTVISRNGTTEKSIIIPYNEIPSANGNCRIDITCDDGHGNVANNSLNVTLNCTCTVSDVVVTGRDANENITVSWNSSAVDYYILQVINEEKIINQFTGYGNTYTIPTRTITQLGYCTFRVVVVKKNVSAYADSNQISITAPRVDVSTVQISGTSLENPIVVTAIQSNADSWEVQVIQNSTVIKKKNGTGAISATFNIGELTTDGDTIFRVIVKNTWGEDSAERSVTLKAPVSNIKDLKVEGDNIDEIINISANGTNVYNWIIQVIQGDTIKLTKYGTGNDIRCSFAQGEIKQKGETLFRVHYSNSWNGGFVDSQKTLNRTEPFIVALEPSGVNQDIDKNINVSWTTQNQHSYVLTIDELTYSGSTATALIIPKDTLSKGSKTMTLTISYISSWGEVRIATYSVNFIAYGKPNLPLFDGATYYSDAQPTFVWEKDNEQVSYRFIIEDTKGAVLLDTQEKISSINEYTSEYEFDNETDYIVKVAIKNQYGKWSDFTSKLITTNFVIANKPTINVYTGNNNVVISLHCEYSSVFDSCEIWRRTEYTDWIRIAYDLDNDFTYVDNFIGSDTYYYKARSLSTSGGRADSETVTANITIKNFNFVNIENMDKSIELIGNPNISITQNIDTMSVQYAGSYAPVIYEGEANYKTGSANFTVRKPLYDKFINMVKSSKVLLYRDGRGEKIYCHLVGNIDKVYESGGVYTLSFNFVEVPFLEKDMFKGDGNLSVVFFDGKYMFNGEANFSGEGV